MTDMRLRAALGLLLAIVPGLAKALPVEDITILTRSGPKVFHVEIAADQDSRELGLMHRTQMAPDAGMLFDFQDTVLVSFWMKDTPLSLDMLFVRPDGRISTIAPNAVPYSTTPIRSAEPVRAVIEINGGLASSLGIAPGDRVRAPIFRRIAPHLISR